MPTSESVTQVLERGVDIHDVAVVAHISVVDDGPRRAAALPFFVVSSFQWNVSRLASWTMTLMAVGLIATRSSTPRMR